MCEPIPKPKYRPLQTGVEGETRLVDAQELFLGGREVHIEHQGQLYRLRITRQNKLILTK